MPTEKNRQALTNRRRFLGCAAGALGVAAAPVREAPEEVIPLKTVYVTCGHEGIPDVPWERLRGKDLGPDELPPEMHLLSRKAGPSNLFLVTGVDILAAVRATYGVFFEGMGGRMDWVRVPKQRDPDQPPERPKFWFIAHFGASHSCPTEWAVTRVATQGERVQVTVSRPVPPDPGKTGLELVRTCDSRAYMLWAPLGERKEKGFTLVAYDETNRETMMTRRVAVVEV